ncbi:PD40 domain-containing protein [Roseiflexus sp. AH-315-K22]|nr:PD40 domain-containing protein [Roseiflexus sp. AH-315-K22]
MNKNRKAVPNILILVAAGGALALGGCVNSPGWETVAAPEGPAFSSVPNPTPSKQAAMSTFDPFNVALAGDNDASLYAQHGSASQRTSLHSSAGSQNYGAEAAHDILGDVLTQESSPSSANPVQASGFNFSQISFSHEGADFDPSVSPNGRKVVFASTQHGPTAELFVKDTQGRLITQLTDNEAHDVMPTISPDGTRVAFASNRRGNWDLFIMPINGGQAVQITTNSTHELHPSWSPDGQFLVYSRLGEVSGRWEMWVTHVFNTGVTHYLGDGLFPEWAPIAGTGDQGGDQILFQRSSQRGDRAFSVWTVDYADGQSSNATEIVGSELAACINPTWSPNAQWIAFAVVPNPEQWAEMTKTRPAASNLWMINRSGSGLVNLTSNDAVNLMPTWASDNTIYFVSDRDGLDNIWSLAASKAIYAATGEMPGGETGTAITTVPETGDGG